MIQNNRNDKDRNEQYPESLFSDSKKFLANKFADKRLSDNIIDRVDKRKRSKIPKPVVDLSVVSTPYSVNGRSFARAQISFTQENDPNFAGANVWVKGYLTDNALGGDGGTAAKEETLPFELKSRIQRSPSTTVFEASSEEVIVGVEAINSDGIGSGLDTMPLVTITLL